MKIKTHYLISKAAAESVNNLTAIEREMFCIGSIIPDLSPLQFIHRHFYSKSSDYVFDKLDRLSVTSSPFAMFNYGKMAHYCSDFCCSVHFDGAIGKISQHRKYEKQLDKYANKHLTRIINQCKNRSQTQPLTSILNSYCTSDKFDYENDIMAAVCACRALCSAAADSLHKKANFDI